ncbi:MAG: hypothetical protein RLZZ361_1483 [Cyanobacteriota bacterium]|jgi:hypothetical protein
MDLKSLFNGIFGGANSNTAPSASPATSAPAPTQSIQLPAQPSSVTTDANRANAAMLAQAQQTNSALQPAQAPQAQSPEAQIKSLFANLDPMQAQNLLMKLKAALMDMLGMGPAQAAEKPAQAQLGPGQAPQANTSDGLDAMLQNILNPAQDGTPTAQASSQQQQPVQLASQTTPAPAPIHAHTQPA